jgi:methylenetetrahydrofolate dehydrogenase (NADP+)/methenyltetrahydrofolate cyclohydrolase
VEPNLVSLAVGDEDPSSKIYISSQMKAAVKLGIGYEHIMLPREAPEEEVLGRIDGLNRDDRVHGIILQRPLPARLDPMTLILHLDPDKDVEGMHPRNLGYLVHGSPRLVPCTAAAAVRLFHSLEMPAKGLEVVIVGHSEIVGKPIALLLVNELATITICHIGTRELKSHTSRADLLFVAAGVPGLIRADMVKPGAVVIDIGINRIQVEEDGQLKSRLVGDVDFEAVAGTAGHITPVPGGVGPVTTAMLMENVVKAAGLTP